MSTVPEDGALPTGPSRVNDYDSFAEAYAAANETGLANAYYERPAILALAGDVAGRRILDAGCGSGPLFAALRDRGAIVTGIDSSAGMLELARRRLGDDARLQRADLNSALPLPDNAFDDVIASLVLHYLEDWTAPLAELRRVLTPGGRLIMSVNHHPCSMDAVEPGLGNGFNFQLAVHLPRVVRDDDLEPCVLGLVVKAKVLSTTPPRHIVHMLDVMRAAQEHFDYRGHRRRDVLVKKPVHAVRSGRCT